LKQQSKNDLKTSGDAVIPLHASPLQPMQSPEEMMRARHQAIEQVAYGRASERGFASGGELDDWLGAEASIDGVQSGNIME
jgi:hypothetical protein